MRNEVCWWLRATIGLLIAGLSGAPGALATTAMAPLTVRELTNRSDLAIHGTVESISSSREGQGIFTEIEVRIQDTLKGRAVSENVVLKLYGGTYKGVRTRVVGGPCLSTQEEVVLFLISNGPDTYDVVSLAEGKFSVVRDHSATAKVERELGGIRYIDTTPPVVPETLDTLKAAVRASAR